MLRHPVGSIDVARSQRTTIDSGSDAMKGFTRQSRRRHSRQVKAEPDTAMLYVCVTISRSSAHGRLPPDLIGSPRTLLAASHRFG
jgi:hypothetical protein